eukprot:12002586-Prorocentrum_lima.AAC.1
MVGFGKKGRSVWLSKVGSFGCARLGAPDQIVAPDPSLASVSDSLPISAEHSSSVGIPGSEGRYTSLVALGE